MDNEKLMFAVLRIEDLAYSDFEKAECGQQRTYARGLKLSVIIKLIRRRENGLSDRISNNRIHRFGSFVFSFPEYGETTI